MLINTAATGAKRDRGDMSQHTITVAMSRIEEKMAWLKDVCLAMQKENAALIAQSEFLKNTVRCGTIIASRLEETTMVINTRDVKRPEIEYGLIGEATLPAEFRPLMYALDQFRDNKRKIAYILKK